VSVLSVVISSLAMLDGLRLLGQSILAGLLLCQFYCFIFPGVLTVRRFDVFFRFFAW